MAEKNCSFGVKQQSLILEGRDVLRNQKIINILEELPMNIPTKFGSKLAQWFHIRLRCEKFTNTNSHDPLGKKS
jgi:hypothetical protein